MDDNSLMPFGKYKGQKMANVPASYLMWLYDSGTKGSVRDYIIDNLDVIKKESELDKLSKQ